jgi:penicillin-binding protein 1C
LDGQDWFPRPEADLVQIEVCAQSGYRAGPNCAHTTTTWAIRTGLRTTACPYCQMIHTDAQQAWRVHSDCERVAAMTPVKWFVLPPAMEWYYKKNHSDYVTLPPYRSDCLSMLPGAAASAMTLIYPDPGGRIYVPIELDSQRGRAVFEAAHRDANATIFWHLDDVYIGETRQIHQMEAAPAPGQHTLTLVDEDGELLQRRFIVLAQ